MFPIPKDFFFENPTSYTHKIFRPPDKKSQVVIKYV